MGFMHSPSPTRRATDRRWWRSRLDRILLETDAPYLAPEPHRSKRNEPAYVSLVLDAVAAIKNVPREKVDEVTTSNARGLFRVDDAERRLQAAVGKK
jgi:hypothetical protein